MTYVTFARIVLQRDPNGRYSLLPCHAHDRIVCSGDLIISGDCGGTNTRLSLWLIPHGSKEFKGASSVCSSCSH